MRSDLTRRGRAWGAGEAESDDAGDRFGMASPSDARHLFEQPWRRTKGNRAADLLPIVQGSYYLASGLWPLLHMRSFEAVTGPKTDRWLVRTVGGLAASLGTGLLLAGRRGYVSRDLRTTSQLAALAFAAVEIPTAARGRIPPIYLADAALELGFVAANLWAAGRRTDPGDRLDILASRQRE